MEKAQGQKLGERHLQIEVFKPKSQRPSAAKNNVYVKNIPFEYKESAEENEAQLKEIKDALQSKFESCGEITSLIVKLNEA